MSDGGSQGQQSLLTKSEESDGVRDPPQGWKVQFFFTIKA
jgi:hypothetical protein